MRSGGNILFSGVGGQGILLASEVTAYALLGAGFDAKKSEVHGMAQRGGSVVAHLRYGDRIYSPLIEPGKADIQVAFEKLEAARYLPYLHENSVVVVNSQQIPPPAVATGKIVYPENILRDLAEKGVKVVEIDAFAAAEQAGSLKSVNIVMVGAMSRFLDVKQELFIEVLETRVKAQFREANKKAFAIGRELAGD